MFITNRWLTNLGACNDAKEFILERFGKGFKIPDYQLLKFLTGERPDDTPFHVSFYERVEWAAWGISRIMGSRNTVYVMLEITKIFLPLYRSLTKAKHDPYLEVLLLSSRYIQGNTDNQLMADYADFQTAEGMLSSIPFHRRNTALQLRKRIHSAGYPGVKANGENAEKVLRIKNLMWFTALGTEEITNRKIGKKKIQYYFEDFFANMRLLCFAYQRTKHPVLFNKAIKFCADFLKEYF